MCFIFANYYFSREINKGGSKKYLKVVYVEDIAVVYLSALAKCRQLHDAHTSKLGSVSIELN